MIIDYSQRKDSIQISYVTKDSKIDIEEIFPDGGYFNYVACDEYDPDRIPDLTSFYGSPVKRESDKSFKGHNINEFFDNIIPNYYKDSFEKLNLLNEPLPFSCDIETEITDKYGYSNQNDVENRILSISMTDYGLNTMLFIVRNPEHPEFNDLDKNYINSILQDATEKYYDEYGLDNWQIVQFDSEFQMLTTFVESVNKYFHMVFGWNFLDFDWQYIFNRCKKLGIDVKKASPTNSITERKIEINENTSITVKTPKHRIIDDYMLMFKKSYTYRSLGSFSLNDCSESVLGLRKVAYKGNLRTLYETDYCKFVAYALVDTILVMLIHRTTNLITVNFFQSYYSGVPYLKINQNPISDALIYKELRRQGKFLLLSEFSQEPVRKYPGGYVKAPTKKIANSLMGIDFNALYPNAMIVLGLSPEAKIDIIFVDDYGIPINETEMQKWLKYKAMGYCLTPTGRIYDVNEEKLFTVIEKNLLAERKHYKDIKNDIYLNIAPKIERQIQELERLVINTK